MLSKRSGLGRNLSALLNQTDAQQVLLDASGPATTNLRVVAIGDLRPGRYQPRMEMDDAGLKELAASIKQQGLLQPLVVRDVDGSYEIIAGERRWRAAQLAGLTDIPIMLHQVDDESAMAMALVENLQREDLTAMDQARAMDRLTNECQLTHQQVANLLGKSRTAVSNYIRLLQLHEDVQALVDSGALEMGHARSLLSIPQEQQPEIASMVVDKQLSVRQTEALVSRLKQQNSESVTKPIQMDKQSAQFEQQLAQLASRLQTKVKLKPGRAGKGAVIIHYDDNHTLEALLSQLTTG